MSLLNRLTPGKFNPLRKLNLESGGPFPPPPPSPFLRCGRTFMEGRSLQRRRPHSQGGTNQQIRVLNLNRRPNINSRPVSPAAVRRHRRRAGFCSRLSVPRIRFSWSRSLVPHWFCDTASTVPMPQTRLICSTAWRLSDIYERRSEKRNSEQRLAASLHF